MNTSTLTAFVLSIFLQGFALFWATPVFSETKVETSAVAPVQVRLISDFDAVAPGEVFEVALEFTPEPGWHTYWKNPGDIGFAPQLKWSASVPLAPSGTAFEIPHRVSSSKKFTNFGFEGRTLIGTVVRVPSELSPGALLRIQVQGKWLVCKDVCVPGKGGFTREIRVVRSGESVPASPEIQAVFLQSRQNRPQLWPKNWNWTWEKDTVSKVWRGTLKAGPGISLPPTALVNQTQPAFDFFPHQKGFILSNSLPVARPQTLDSRTLQWQWAADRESLPGDGSPSGGLLKLGQEYFESARAEDEVKWDVLSTEGKAAQQSGEKNRALLSILGALLGGLILNLMPCVFPVLWLKALKLVAQAHEDRKKRLQSAFGYTLGILISFWGVAGLLIALRYGGQALGWGFQLQSPVFVYLMAALFVLLSLNLAGLFEFTFPSVGRGTSRDENSWRSSLATGVLAVVVATPCTAPFMGSALGYALTASNFEAFLIFTALGLGLASPYLVLSALPNLGRFLPKPGPWMVTFKKALALPMLLTTVWLLWVLGLQRGMGAVALAVISFLLLAVPLLRVGAQQKRGQLASVGSWVPVGVIVIAAGLTLSQLKRPISLLGLGGVKPEETSQQDVWQKWSPEAEQEARTQGPVFIDFTAAWCVTCQVNEQAVLNRAEIQAAFRAKKVTLLKADWTDEDPRITQALADYGRSGVPLYVVIPQRGEPVLLPQILTVQSVFEVLDRIP
jgi:thiol:disulfide interchange protein